MDLDNNNNNNNNNSKGKDDSGDSASMNPQQHSKKHGNMLRVGLPAVQNALVRDGRDPGIAYQLEKQEKQNSVCRRHKAKGAGPTRVISGPRSMNGGIVLARLKIGYDKLADMVDKMELGKLDRVQLGALKKFLPTIEERASLIEDYLKKADSSKEAAMGELSECEKYMVRMMGVKNAHAKLDCMMGKFFKRVNLPPTTAVEFFTDVEGNWDYFLTLVQNSNVVNIDSENRLSLAPNSMFVHGGDAPDKGPGDIRIVKALVQLKIDHPDRVFLICGNRDVNKLRFMSELAEGQTGKNADIYWDPNHKPYQQYIQEEGMVDGPIATLKWMLECTMGCPTTFETRRMELATQKDIDNVSMISDEHVLESFKESVNPNGEDPWMLDYVRHGQLMLILGDCAFVHGGIDESCLGKVPGRQGNITGGMEAWCEALNNFKQDMVAEFERQPEFDKSGKFGGELLKDYGVPNSARAGPTVIYNNHVENGNCVVPDVKTLECLAQAGIKRLFTGHQPVGECPSVVSVKDLLTIVMGDTSYSDTQADKSLNPGNNRGIAFSNVVITCSGTTVTGKLASGVAHGYTLEQSSSAPDAFVGRQLQDESWVKTVVEGKLLVAKGEGRKISTRLMEIDDVLSQLSNTVDNGWTYL